MFRLVGILLLLGSCSARWYCGEGYVSGIVSYAMAFGNEGKVHRLLSPFPPPDINECCRQHDDAYVLAENHPYAKWEIRRLADEQMLRCMTENDRGM